MTVLLALGANSLKAQYFHYSQYDFTTQRVNPAMVGLSNYANASLIYRNQKTGGDFNINSNFFSASFPFLSARTRKPWSGIGIALLDDRTAGIFRTQELALSYAFHVQINKFQSLSFGMKALIQSRRISYDGFYTGSQYIPDRGFDITRASGENFTALTNTVKTFSTGIYWQSTDKKGQIKHHAGFSIFDLNGPEDSFLGEPSTLSSTVIFSSGVQAAIISDIHIMPEVMVAYSANELSLNTGARFQKALSSRTRRFSDHIDLILKYAIRRSGIVGIQLHRENISVGLSYDFPISKNPGNLGALELAIELRKLVSPPPLKLKKRRKKSTQKNEVTAKPRTRRVSQARSIKSVGEGTDPTTLAKVKKDSIEIVTTPKSDSTAGATAKAIGQAGRLKQEPYIVEDFTFHFAFEFNSSVLDKESRQFLQDLVKTLKENEYLKVKIAGHTDSVGSDEFNLLLSQNRADAVKHQLKEYGISLQRIISEGKGEREPLNDNATEAARAKNRRVEISIVYE